MTEVLAMRNEYRMEQWADVVRKCRESGLSNREFCRQNGISEKTYYYRLRKLREAAVNVGKAENTTLCRVDLSDDCGGETEHGQIRLHFHGAEIEVAHGASSDTLKMVLRILNEL